MRFKKSSLGPRQTPQDAQEDPTLATRTKYSCYTIDSKGHRVLRYRPGVRITDSMGGQYEVQESGEWKKL